MHIINGMNTEMVLLVRGGMEQHREFRNKFQIRPRILIDGEGKIGEAYGVYQPHTEGSADYPIYMAPAVYLIDAEGKVSCFWLLSGPRGRPSPECILGILALAQQQGWKY